MSEQNQGADGVQNRWQRNSKEIFSQEALDKMRSPEKLDHALSITTPIGIGVAEELGGYVAITVASIVISGILGNIFAETVCNVFGIQEPVAKGIAIGCSSHALGTVKALEMGEVEGAMSSLSIALAGILTVAAASVFATLL